MSGKGDDVAALQAQIVALKTEGAEASAEIDRLKQERALASSFDEARELEDRIARQIWVTEHAAAEIPQLELRLAAARAADQAAQLAKHRGILIGLYPQLKAAILAAVEAQSQVCAARDAAVAALGEAMVARNLPTVAYAGFLFKDLVEIWQAENDRVFADLARRPKPAAIPAPALAALPAPTKPKPPVAITKQPAPRPARKMRHDPFPTDGQAALVVFIRSGAELDDGTTAVAGDQIALSVQRARELVSHGAADYVKQGEAL